MLLSFPTVRVLPTGPSARGQVPPVPWQRHGSQPLFPEGSGAGARQQPGPAGGELAWPDSLDVIIHCRISFGRTSANKVQKV